jgi:carboxymethylenebutenolidase
MQNNNELEALVHLWEDGAFNRRELVKRLTRLTGSALATAAALETFRVPAEAQTPACPADVRVPENAPDVDSVPVEFGGQAGTLFGYWTRTKPMPEIPMAGVLVIHENRGLSDYILDVTRRIARAGYVGLAIDLLSRQGGTGQFTDPVEQMNAYNRTRPEENLQDMQSALTWLRSLSYVSPNRVGVIGFCAGGGNVMNLLVNTKDLAAAVAFYPASMPSAQDISDKLSAPVLFNLGELDSGVTGRVAAVVPTLLSTRKKFALRIYDGANHAFHNDTGPRYEPASACDAWNQSLTFLDRFVKSPPAG